MSGDVQTRQRRKEKKKQKREDEAPLPGVDTSKFNETEKKSVQMHIHESDHHGDHGAGICAKIIFFTLMAILLGLVTLIVLENRGGSDVDTPLSESRFSEYLQGWVDENRQDDHHDEPHFSPPDDDHDDSDHAAEETHHDGEHTEINDDEPYPEEKDVSNDENDDEENSQELNAEINNNEESNQEDVNDNASQENDDNENLDQNYDNDDNDDDDDNNEQNDNEPEGTNDNDDDDNDNDGLEDNNNNESEVPNLFEDSAPFDEEKKINRHHLTRKVDELYDTYNEIADMLGKDRLDKNKPILNKREVSKGDDDDGIADSKDIFENVVDNDAGEEILLQKLAEESEQEQNQQQDQDENEEEGSSSQIPESGGAQSSYMEELLRQQALEENPVVKELYDKAKEMDVTSENERSNKMLIEAIGMYKTLIEQYGDKLNDTIFKQVAERCINRMRFLGKLKSAVDIHYKLIRRFVDEPSFRNQLAVTFLLGNRLSAAKLVLHEVLSQWRYNGFALVHYGFVLKNLDQDYENAVLYLREGIETNEEGTQDGRFYFNLGDALQRLGRNEEAQNVYRKGAEIGLFLSEYQRSLYNVDRLKSKPFWTKLDTTYKDELTEIYKYWQVIRDEGLKLLSQNGLFTNEQENLKDTGDWKQFELYARGSMTKNCHMAPITCQLIKNFKAASSCKRGQVKFSVLHPNTHVHSHCGPTNCRIRAHLGLKVPENTFIRVANETRSWKDGEWLIFDDSYEHEVWQNGTSLRLVLIVDVWHPDLTEEEKSSMSPI